MSDKVKFPLAEARAVAQDLLFTLKDSCERIIIAGSIRREKPFVSDIELLFIPKFELRPVPGDMFATQDTNLAHLAINKLIEERILDKRLNVNGSPAWGRWNKLAVHLPTGIPVDLFESTSPKWWNMLVCRTGPRELNERIAALAKGRACMWHPCDIGFTDPRGDWYTVTSEEAVFKFVGLPYAEPQDRK